MNCQLFEQRVSEYLDHELTPELERECAEHLMRCIGCRTLARDVEFAVGELRNAPVVSPSPGLQARTLSISKASSELSCGEFEDLITDFLDGFVSADIYHAFQAHASDCGVCAETLTETVYAVAACHSIHFQDSYEVPEEIIQSILNRTSVVRERRRARWSAWRRWLDAAREVFQPVTTPQWAAGFAIVGASMLVLLYGISDDGSVAGVARRTNAYATRSFSRGQTLVPKKDSLIQDLRNYSSKIAAFWRAHPETGSKMAPAGAGTQPPDQLHKNGTQKGSDQDSNQQNADQEKQGSSTSNKK